MAPHHGFVVTMVGRDHVVRDRAVVAPLRHRGPAGGPQVAVLHVRGLQDTAPHARPVRTSECRTSWSRILGAPAAWHRSVKRSLYASGRMGAQRASVSTYPFKLCTSPAASLSAACCALVTVTSRWCPDGCAPPGLSATMPPFAMTRSALSFCSGAPPLEPDCRPSLTQAAQNGSGSSRIRIPSYPVNVAKNGVTTWPAPGSRVVLKSPSPTTNITQWAVE